MPELVQGRFVPEELRYGNERRPIEPRLNPLLVNAVPGIWGAVAQLAQAGLGEEKPRERTDQVQAAMPPWLVAAIGHDPEKYPQLPKPGAVEEVKDPITESAWGRILDNLLAKKRGPGRGSTEQVQGGYQKWEGGNRQPRFRPQDEEQSVAKLATLGGPETFESWRDVYRNEQRLAKYPFGEPVQLDMYNRVMPLGRRERELFTSTYKTSFPKNPYVQAANRVTDDPHQRMMVTQFLEENGTSRSYPDSAEWLAANYPDAAGSPEIVSEFDKLVGGAAREFHKRRDASPEILQIMKDSVGNKRAGTLSPWERIKGGAEAAYQRAMKAKPGSDEWNDSSNAWGQLSSLLEAQKRRKP